MAVKMNDSHRPICTVDGSEERKCNGVVTAEGDDSRQSLALQGWTDLVCICDRRPRQDTVMAFFDLLEGKLVIVASFS
jgi:hypothetical protein